MSSSFYYPTNTGSLGDPRRPRSSMSPLRASPSQSQRECRTLVRERTVLVVEDDDNTQRESNSNANRQLVRGRLAPGR